MNSSMNTSDSEEKSEFVANLNAFRQIDFFSGVSIEVMKLFSFLCQRQAYKAGDYIFRQDDDDGCSYYVLSGKAKLVLEKNNLRKGLSPQLEPDAELDHRDFAFEAALAIYLTLSICASHYDTPFSHHGEYRISIAIFKKRLDCFGLFKHRNRL